MCVCTHVLVKINKEFDCVFTSIGDIPASLKFAKRLVESITVFSNLSLQLEEAGWVTSRLQLGTGEWRYSWLHVPLTPEDHPHSI